jgi:hypothetical protein
MAVFTDYHEHLLQIVGKLFFGFGHTGINKTPWEERERFDPTEPLPSRVIYNVDEVWGNQLPGVIPTVDTADIEVYQTFPAIPGEQGAWQMAQRTDVGATFCWLATLAGGGGPGVETDPRLENWVPAKYGKLWEAAIYEDAGATPGAQVPWTHVSGPLWDNQSGILTFENDPVAAGLTPPFWVKGYRYIGPTLEQVIAGISAGASIVVEDSVPTPFPGTNIVQFGPNFSVVDLGGGRVQVTIASSSTWPWPDYEMIIVGASGSVGVPQDFPLAAPVTSMDEKSFVFIEGVKMTYGPGKDYTFTGASTIRFFNAVGRTILQAGMEIEIFHD